MKTKREILAGTVDRGVENTKKMLVINSINKGRIFSREQNLVLHRDHPIPAPGDTIWGLKHCFFMFSFFKARFVIQYKVI